MNPYRHFLRSRLRRLGFGYLAMAIISLAAGTGRYYNNQNLQKADYSALELEIPREVKEAFRESDDTRLAAAIRNHPREALAWLVDRRHGLSGLREEELEKLIRRSAPFFPIDKLGNDFGKIFAQKTGLRSSRDRKEMQAALFLLQASGHLDAGSWIEAGRQRLER